MAAIARRTWAQMKTEVTLRIGNPNNTTIDVEHFIWAAYLRIALTYHHFELDAIPSNLTLSTSVNSVALPSDTYIVMNTTLLDVAGTTVVSPFLQEYEYQALVRSFTGASGVPTLRARFGASLYFDTVPDLAYKLRVSHYRRPTAPDFSGSATSELDVECDEHIIEQAVALATGATGAPGTALNRQLLTDWLAEQVRGSLLEGVSDRRERVATDRTVGGAQG